MYVIFTYGYEVMSEYNNRNKSEWASEGERMQMGFEESNSRGCDRLII